MKTIILSLVVSNSAAARPAIRDALFVWDCFGLEDVSIREVLAIFCGPFFRRALVHGVIIQSLVLSAAVAVAVAVPLAAVVTANAVAQVVITCWAGYVVRHGIIIQS
jgi:hypothetical protein